MWPRRFVPVAEEHVVYGSVGQDAPDDENDLGHYNGGNETGDPIGSHHAHDKGARIKIRLADRRPSTAITTGPMKLNEGPR